MTQTKVTTRSRLLAAFLRVAVEKGIDATSTKSVAEAAGTSELTLFRHFGDKATLARAAILHAAPLAAVAAHELDFDVSTSDAAAAGIASCLSFLRDQTVRSGGLMQFALAEGRRHPELSADLKRAPLAAQSMLARALDRASPQLRAGVDRRTALFVLQGVLLFTLSWTSLGWMRLPRREWDALLADAARLVVREPRRRGGPRRKRGGTRRRPRARAPAAS